MLGSPNAKHVNLLFSVYASEWTFWTGLPTSSCGVYVYLGLDTNTRLSIVKKESKSKWLATIAVGLLVINRNWER